MLIIRISLLLSLVIPAAAQAEFVLQSNNSTTEPIAVQPAPANAGAQNEAKEKADRPEKEAAAPKKIKLHHVRAHGFGNQIPLTFAVRQIVPRGFTVSFDKGVNQEALVDWHGEQSWTAALRQAVKPLKLKVVLEDSTVRIKKI